MEGEGASNGGILYHEVQEGKLCAVHCVNTVLQGPFFSEFDLAALASDLDRRERQVMLGNEGGGGAGGGAAEAGDFLLEGGEGSHNVSLGGDFSIQVLQKALEVWDLLVIPINSPDAEAVNDIPEQQNAFICHLHDHWFCIRKVNGEWYNFNSLYPAPEHLSKFYLTAYLDTLRGSGWSIFAVTGNFPTECPMTSEASNGFGQWLTPEDAKRINNSCNEAQANKRQKNYNDYAHQGAYSSSQGMSEMDIFAVQQQEEEDLNAAIAASLMDSAGPATGFDKAMEQDHSKDASTVTTGPAVVNNDENAVEHVTHKSQASEPGSDCNTEDSGITTDPKDSSSLEVKEKVKDL